MILSKDYDKFLIFTLVAFSISLAGLVVVHILSSNAAYAQQQISTAHSIQNNTNFNTLFVTGTANTKIKPDKVILTLGVETNNKTANAALEPIRKVVQIS
jgi:uncharacterized protein